MNRRFDTAVCVPGDGTYVFADDLVWRYAPGRQHPVSGYPRPITQEFPGTFPRRLDAALVDPDGDLLLFRGDRYIRYDLGRGRPRLGFPRPYAHDWPGQLPDRIDAAIQWNPEMVYVFHGDAYTSLSSHDALARPGYPKPIVPNWPGLSGGPVRAALTLPDGRRLLITDAETQAYSEDGSPVDPAGVAIPMLDHVDGVAQEASSGAPVLHSRRFLASPARAELEAIAEGRLRLGRRTDPSYPAPILSQGPVVKEIQATLVELGWRLPRYGADGRFGNETYATVLDYKRRHHILTAGGSLDGIVGVETIRHIDAALPPAAPAPGPAKPDDGLSRWRTLLGPEARDGNDVVELIDGGDAFRAMHDAIRTATGPGHYVYLLGWWLDLDEPLDPSVPDGPRASTMRSLLAAASQRGVQVRVMLWDKNGAKNTAEVAFVNTLANGAAILDNHQGGVVTGYLVGSQHQKVLVVNGEDGLVGFCGGVDINCDRVKSKAACHQEVTDNVVVQASGASGNEGQPLHDVHCRIAGPAVHDLLEVVIKRWHANDRHLELDAAKGALRGLSEPLPHAAGGALVRVGSTFNATATMPKTGKTTFQDRSVQEILLTVIGNARRYIYIEEQYMISLCAAEAIKRALEHVEHVTILIAPSEICDLPRRWEFRKRFLDHISPSPLAHKVTVVTPAPTFAASGHVTFGPHTYVHAKMLIVDDEVAVIGSANMNRRGWEHDAEVVAAVAGPGRDGTPLARKLRMRLWAEHLGVPYGAVSDAVASQYLWRTSPGRVTLYNPIGGTDSHVERQIPEALIDPASPLASAPCCRFHGLGCPSRGSILGGLTHESESQLTPLQTSFELVAAEAGFESVPHLTAAETEGGTTESLAVRILWPALGFPAVIAPRGAQAADSSTPSGAHQASVLILSNRPTLSADDAARNLRIVPWEQRSRRYVAPNESGSFAAADLAVRTDSPGTPLFQSTHDDRGDVVRFGGDGQHTAIAASLARPVRAFYERQGLRYLHEIRVSEAACARLPDGQYHLFWNGSPNSDDAPSAEMKLLLDQYARPTRSAELKPDGRHERLNIATLLDEYEFEFGPLHPPYQQTDREKRRVEVLHPLFVTRALVSRPGSSVMIAHVTDTHVNVRADVYEENLKSNDPSITWDGAQLWFKKNRLIRYNNFNRSFDQVYADAKRGSDVILITGDLIDYGRGPLGLVDNGRYRNRLDEDWTYQADRNWFLFYYLLASRGNYSSPAYTILGNHDWRLNPYPPFAPGAPDPPIMLHNYPDFTPDEQKTIIQAAHGHGYDTKYSYSELGAERMAKAIAGYFTGELSFDGSPLETTVASVLWYLLLINPFLDYTFVLPGGQQVLMLDWGKDEEIYNFESARNWMEYSQRAKNCLSSLQESLVTEFAHAPGNAKVIGIHAPPLGPADRWTDDDLRQGEKVFQWDQDSRMRNPGDGKVIKVEKHSLCAIAPKDAPFGVAAVYGSIVQRRDSFIRQVGESESGIRLILSGHIHRGGLLVAYPPTNDRDARLLRSVDYADVANHGRGVGRGIAAIRSDGTGVRAFPAPLYVNTTSAGPRGNQYLPAQTSEGYLRNNVAPGWVRVELAADGTVRSLSAQQVAEPASPRPASSPRAREAAPYTHRSSHEFELEDHTPPDPLAAITVDPFPSALTVSFDPASSSALQTCLNQIATPAKLAAEPTLQQQRELQGAATLAAAVVDLNDPAKLAYAGHFDDDTYYVGSLGKTAPMYAAFELRVRVQRAVSQARAAGLDVTKPDWHLPLVTALERKWRPVLAAGFPHFPQSFPDLNTMFEFARGGAPDHEVSFRRTTPLPNLASDSYGEFGEPTGLHFDEWLTLMILWSNNHAADRVITTIGYSYLNGLLHRAGLFTPVPAASTAPADGSGIWVSGSYASRDWKPGADMMKLSARGTAHYKSTTNFVANARQVAKLLTLAATQTLFGADAVGTGACGDMVTLMIKGVAPGNVSFIGDALTTFGIAMDSVSSKIGIGVASPRSGRVGVHDCAIVRRTRPDGVVLRYVSVVLGAFDRALSPAHPGGTPPFDPGSPASFDRLCFELDRCVSSAH